MTTTPSRRAARAVAGALIVTGLVTGLLTGCGVAGTDFQPGVAAQVGDVQIKTNEVDEIVTGACDYYADNPQPGAGAEPRSALRAGLVQLLVERAVLSQLVDDTDVKLGGIYYQTMDQVDRTTADLPDDQGAALNAGSEASTYVNAALVALGAALLEDEGTSDPDDTASGQRGQQAVTDWLKDHDVDINPVYGVTVDDDGQIVFNDDADLSRPVSDVASRGVVTTESPDPAQVSALPGSQRCG